MFSYRRRKVPRLTVDFRYGQVTIERTDIAANGLPR
jgi:hypothetical protein